MKSTYLARSIYLLGPIALLVVFFQNCSQQGFTALNQNASQNAASLGGPGSGSPKLASVTLGWDPSPEAQLAGYKIYYRLSSASVPTPVDVGLLAPVNGVVSYKLPNLNLGQTYYFSVVAYDSNMVESPSSNEVSQAVQ